MPAFRTMIFGASLAVAAAIVPATAVNAALSGSAASAATCAPVTWGSNPKSVWDSATETGDVVGVRAGRHACYDRMVIDLNGLTAGYALQYEPQIYPVAGGPAIPLRGGAKLSVIAYAPEYDENLQATTSRAVSRSELVDVTGFSTFRQVAWAGTYSGSTGFGLGVRARLPYRVFIINERSGSRIVVDVAHTW